MYNSNAVSDVAMLEWGNYCDKQQDTCFVILQASLWRQLVVHSNVKAVLRN